MDENLLLDCLNTLSEVIQTVNKSCKFFLSAITVLRMITDLLKNVAIENS